MSRVRTDEHYQAQKLAKRRKQMYFYGDECPKCETSQYYAASGRCVECLKSARREKYKDSLKAKLAKENAEKAKDRELSGWIAKHKQNPMYQVWGGL